MVCVDATFNAFALSACVYGMVLHIQVDVCEYTLLLIHYCLHRLGVNLHNYREWKKSNMHQICQCLVHKEEECLLM